MEHDINFFNCWSIVDLISIGGSKGGGARNPPVQLFSFSWSFRQKSCQIIGFYHKIKDWLTRLGNPGSTTDQNPLAIHNYRPQTKLREANVFTPVCHSVLRGRRAFVSQYAMGWGVHPLDRPPGQTPPSTPNLWADPLLGRPPPRAVHILLECILVMIIFVCLCQVLQLYFSLVFSNTP